MKDLTLKTASIFILALLYGISLLSPPCLAGETVRGSLFTAYLGDDCNLELTFPTSAGGTASVKSLALTAAGEHLSCSRFRLEQNWLYFTARSAGDASYKGTMTIEKTGVVKFELIRSDSQPVQWNMSFTSVAEEHYYGFGDNAGRLDYHGQVSVGINHDANPDSHGESRGDNSFKSVPFFSSSRGYGVWLDDTVAAIFDMDSSGGGEWTLSFEDDCLRLFFFAGPELTDVLMRYTSLSGRPPLWPKWVFAPWKGRGVYRNSAEFEEDITRGREFDIPASVILIDTPWETAYNSFNFNGEQFENPRDMLKKAHEYGYKALLRMTPMSNVINNPGMAGTETIPQEHYNTIMKNDGFVRDENGNPAVYQCSGRSVSLLDFTNPWTVNYIISAVKHLAEIGVDGFEADDGECDFVSGVKFYDNSIPARRMKNYYSCLYTKTVYDAWKEATGEPAVWARSGCAGAQQFSMQLPGNIVADWGHNGLSSFVISAQSSAMSGYSIWGRNIAGHPDRDLSPELFVRWTQLSAFTPVMETFTGSSRGAWDIGDAALETARRYAKLHTSLFPYIYSYAKEARDTGLPIIRPLPLLYQDDQEAHVQRHQYLFGNDILVAPVVEEGATTREVYFPKGAKWYEFWGDIYHEGGTLETVASPVEEIPFFIREGAIIPMLPDDVDTLADPADVKIPDVKTVDDRLIVRVWPSENKSRLRMADGSIFVAERKTGKTTIEVSANNMRLWLDVADTRALTVTVNDRNMEKKTCRDVISGEEGWCYSVTLHDTVVHFKSGDKPVVINMSE